jgi:amino acid transporter
MVLLTGSQALFNHRGIRVTTRLTDFSGWWILLVSTALVVALLIAAHSLQPARLVTFDNFSGLPPGEGAAVWPRNNNLALLFLLGLLLPAYTLTGFDASAHTAEETLGAAVNVPRGIVRSVLVSGAFGWVMLAAVILAAPDLRDAALQGKGAFVWIIDGALARPAALALFGAIAVAQYLCGLATVTSASRMAYAFARDGGLPFSHLLRQVSASHRTPACAIWTVGALAVLFTVYAEVYETIAAVCAVFLYVSYVLPTALGLVAFGRSWTRMGPWHLGRWYRPLALLSVAGCVALFGIAVQPPNEKVVGIVGGAALLLVALWFAYARRSFRGPPSVLVGREK